MIARIAYLTSPSPNRYLLNFQVEHSVEMSIEISEAHLANIIVDGASFALRKSYSHRVPETQTESAKHERAAGTQ